MAARLKALQQKKAQLSGNAGVKGFAAGGAAALNPAVLAGQMRLEAACQPALLVVDPFALQAAIDEARSAGVPEPRLVGATIRLSLARSAQAAAQQLSNAMAPPVLEVDAKGLERAIEATRELSWRCEELIPHLTKAETFLAECREAQVASRALERMMGKGMTGINTSKLKGAIDLAKAKGLNVKGAEQMASAAPAAQAALKALEEALAPDDLLEIDTVKLKELLEAARKAKAPEKELAVCESDLADAIAAQADAALDELLGEELTLTYNVPKKEEKKKVVKEVKEEKGNAFAAFRKGRKKGNSPGGGSSDAEASEEEKEEEEAAPKGPYTPLTVPLDRLSTAVRDADGAKLDFSRRQLASKQLAIARAAQEAASEITEYFDTRPPMLEVDAGRFAGSIERAKQSGVPHDYPLLVDAIAACAEIRAMQAAHRELKEALAWTSGLEELDVPRLTAAVENASSLGMDEEVLRPAEKRLLKARDLHNAWNELTECIQGNTWEVSIPRLEKALKSSLTQGVPGEHLEEGEEKLKAAQAAQRALRDLQRATKPDLCEVNLVMLTDSIEGANKNKLPEKFIKDAEAKLSEATEAQNALKAAHLREQAPTQRDRPHQRAA